MEREFIFEAVLDNISNDLGGKSLDQAVEYLTNLKAEYTKRGYTYLYISSEGDYDSQWLALHGERPETDREYDLRKSAYQKRREEKAKLRKKKEEKELAVYLKLKKKFEHEQTK